MNALLVKCFKPPARLNNYSNIIIVFMALTSWESHCKSSPSSFDECKTVPASACAADLLNRHLYATVFTFSNVIYYHSAQKQIYPFYNII